MERLNETVTFRLAKPEESDQIRTMYKQISRDMYTNGIRIWDYNYPVGLVKNDIENKQLYGFFNWEKCIGSFSLCQSDIYDNAFEWRGNSQKAIYCERVAVALEVRHQGIGSSLYEKAICIARDSGFTSLRALVVDSNIPAIRLCESCGFTRVNGTFQKRIDSRRSLLEYGFEILLN